MADPNPLGAFNAPSPDLNALIQTLLAGGGSSGVTIPGQGTASAAITPIAPPPSAAIQAAPQLQRPVIGQGQAPQSPVAPLMSRTQTAPAASNAAAPHPAARVAANANDPVLKATVEDLTTGMSPELKAVFAGQQRLAKETHDAIIKNEQARAEILRQEQALKTPDMPVLQNYGTPPPNAPNIQPLQAFGGWGVALAMIGSLLTRRPLTAALKVGAAAMKSYTEARWKDYQVQHQIWQDSVDQAMRQNELELQRYKMQWDQHANDLDMLGRQMENIAANNKDELMLYHLQQGQYDEAFKLIAHREDLQAQYALRRDLAAERAANRGGGRGGGGTGGGGKTPAKGSVLAQLLDDFRREWALAHNGQMPSTKDEVNFIKSTGLGPNAAHEDAQQQQENIAEATHKDIQDAIGMIQASPLVVGGPGVVGRYFGITGWMTKDPSGAQLFQSKITRIQTELGRALKTRQLTNADIGRAQEMVRGLGTWDTPATAIKTLQDADNWLATIRGKPWVYKTPDEAGQAFQNGEIDEAEFRSILATQFNIH